jgi:hypothetical protein
VKVSKASMLEPSPDSRSTTTIAGQRSDQKSNSKTSPNLTASSFKKTAHDFPIGLKTVATGALGFALALMLWEVILRLTVESSQGMSEHPALGKIDNSGPMIHSKEGYNRTRLNSLGMRAAEPTPKQAGEYRILMLGDSFTRADEMSDGLNFSDRLQAGFSLAQQQTKANTASARQPQTNPVVQIINTGKPSASPASYLYAADFHRKTFAPDSVVIQLTEHDFTMDMNNEASEFYLEKKGQKKDQKKGESNYQVRHNLEFGSAEPLAQAVMEYAPRIRSLLQMSTLRIGGRNLNQLLSPATAEPADAEPLPPGSEAFKLTQAEDTAMVRWTVQQLKQQFPNAVLLFLPAMNYQDAAEVSSDPRNAAIEKALTEAAAKQGIPLINMRADFLAHYRSLGTHLNGFNNTVPGQGHLNNAGHKLVAQRLMNFYNQPNSPLRRN